MNTRRSIGIGFTYATLVWDLVRPSLDISGPFRIRASSFEAAPMDRPEYGLLDTSVFREPTRVYGGRFEREMA